jgi:hypothetical protein
VIAVTVLLAAGVILNASGPMGLYGIIDKVVFEPNDSAPERMQLWGAFAYVEGQSTTGLQTSAAKRGYLYFRLPDGAESQLTAVKREWADLKSVAGTGQAVAFGRWGYIGGFGALQPDTKPTRPSMIYENVPRGGADADLRVRPQSEAPASPTAYQPNVGVVRLTEASHAAIIKQLKDAVKK